MAKRTRQEILKDIVALSGPLGPLEDELAGFGWDSDERLVVLTAADAINVLDRFARGELTAAECAAWAEALEMREDLGFESAFETVLKDLLLTGLSHPDMNGPLTLDSIAAWRALLVQP